MVFFLNYENHWCVQEKPTTIRTNQYYRGVGMLDKEDSVVRRTGAKLRHFRILKGISQEQLALDCDLNINTIGMIERGQTNGLEEKIDIFFAAGKLTESEYQELIAMLKAE